MPRVEMWENMYDDLIKDRGQDAEWERACVCRCITKESGQPNYSCPICGGSGYRYLKAGKIRVAVTAFNSRVEIETPELREPGTAYVTPRDDVIMGYKDRLRFPNFKCIFSEVLRFSEEDYGRGISSKTYRNIKEIVFLADDKFEYELGVDFEVTEDNHHIRWLDKQEIPKLDGKSFSLLYYTTPSYLVTDILHELRATMSMRKTPTEKFIELPKQYKLHREDFIYGINNPEPVLEKPKILDEKIEGASESGSKSELDSTNVNEVTIE